MLLPVKIRPAGAPTPTQQQQQAAASSAAASDPSAAKPSAAAATSSQQDIKSDTNASVKRQKVDAGDCDGSGLAGLLGGYGSDSEDEDDGSGDDGNGKVSKDAAHSGQRSGSKAQASKSPAAAQRLPSAAELLADFNGVLQPQQHAVGASGAEGSHAKSATAVPGDDSGDHSDGTSSSDEDGA